MAVVCFEVVAEFSVSSHLKSQCNPPCVLISHLNVRKQLLAPVVSDGNFAAQFLATLPLACTSVV